MSNKVIIKSAMQLLHVLNDLVVTVNSITPLYKLFNEIYPTYFKNPDMMSLNLKDHLKTKRFWSLFFETFGDAIKRAYIFHAGNNVNLAGNGAIVFTLDIPGISTFVTPYIGIHNRAMFNTEQVKIDALIVERVKKEAAKHNIEVYDFTSLGCTNDTVTCDDKILNTFINHLDTIELDINALWYFHFHNGHTEKQTYLTKLQKSFLQNLANYAIDNELKLRIRGEIIEYDEDSVYKLMLRLFTFIIHEYHDKNGKMLNRQILMNYHLNFSSNHKYDVFNLCNSDIEVGILYNAVITGTLNSAIIGTMFRDMLKNYGSCDYRYFKYDISVVRALNADLSNALMNALNKAFDKYNINTTKFTEEFTPILILQNPKKFTTLDKQQVKYYVYYYFIV
jgi:hypothetical protein